MIYVNTNTGNDSNDGSLSAPYKTITKALSVAVSGEMIIINDGKYLETFGVATADLTIVGIGNVIIDGLSREIDLVNFNGLVSQINITKDNIHLKNITIINSPCMALRVAGNNGIYEGVKVYDNYLGFFIYGTNNEFYDCESMYNFDFGGTPWGEDNAGENADGFSISGNGNKFYRCKSAFNADDGFDTYGARFNQFNNCITFYNGVNLGCRNRDKTVYEALTFKGNGNGFKMGPGPLSTTPDKRRSASNTLTYCVSYNNLGDDFDCNGGSDNRFINCKASNDASDLSEKRAFRLGDITNVLSGDDTNTYFTNCLAYPHNVDYLTIGGTSTQINNSWNTLDIAASDFESIDITSEHFLHIPVGGRLVQMGIYDEKVGDQMSTITEFKTWLNDKYPRSAALKADGVTLQYTDTKLVTDLNDSQSEIYIDLDNRLGNDYKLSASTITVANQLAYDLPLDCEITSIVKIEVENSSGEYEEYKKIGIAEYLPNGKYYTRGETGKFNLYYDRTAITTAGLTIKIYYYPSPVALSASNMSAVPDLNPKYHNLLKYKLAQKCASAGENPDVKLANYYETLYQEYLAKVKEDIQSKDATCGEYGNQIEEGW